jgi:hypothetical protein
MCRPARLKIKAFICSDRSLIGALHVRDEFRPVRRPQTHLPHRCGRQSPSFISHVMSCYTTSHSQKFTRAWDGVPRRAGGERRSPPSH